MKFSILDVAKQAGVSKSTVSRVLNGGSVGIKTRQIIMETIEKMEYEPNYMARGLRGVKNKVIGITSLGREIFSNSSLVTRFSGINYILQKNGYDLLLVQHENTNNIKLNSSKYIKYFMEERIDGLIALGYSDFIDLKSIADKFRNIVYTGERLYTDRGFRIYMGNYNYSCELYEHLIKNGHTKILTISILSRNQKQLFNTRQTALMDMCQKYGVIYNADSFLQPIEIYGDINCDNFLNQIYNTFDLGKYSAIFVDDAEFAKSIITFFATKNLIVYDDYSIVAIERGIKDKISADSLVTSILLPDYEYGAKIAGLMLEVINNHHLEYEDIIIPYSFKMGKSVKNIL